MILVVAGPATKRFDRLRAKIVAMGASALYRFSVANNPLKPDGVDRNGEREPGYVSAITTGRADWMEK